MEKRSRIGILQIAKSFFIILLAFLLSAFFNESYALVFNVVPNGPLPTVVAPGGTVAASYLVTNNTLSQRNNNFVKYLPPNVSIAGGGCADNFNLAPHGKPGDTCILNLSVTGAVNAADPNPHHHLFVCFPGGISCAGTSFPLNVSADIISIRITPVTATIFPGNTQQYTAIGLLANGSTVNITSFVTWISSNPSVATISNTGLATGQNVGSTNITAKIGPITSNSATLIVKAFVYISNSGANTVNSCVVGAGGTLSGCHVVATGFSDPSLISSNPAGTIAYVSNSANGVISACPIHSDGSLGPCTVAGSGFTTPSFEAVLNPAGTFAYVSNFGTSTVQVCPVNANGSFGTCSNTGNSFASPFGIGFNSAGTFAYIANFTNNTVSLCPVNPNGTFGTCSSAGGGPFTQPGVIIIDGAKAYITNDDATGTISLCAINSNGTFGTCNTIASNLADPAGIALNFSRTTAFVTSFNDNVVFSCPINPNGTFGTCTPAASGFNQPFGIIIHN